MIIYGVEIEVEILGLGKQTLLVDWDDAEEEVIKAKYIIDGNHIMIDSKHTDEVRQAVLLDREAEREEAEASRQIDIWEDRRNIQMGMYA